MTRYFPTYAYNDSGMNKYTTEEKGEREMSAHEGFLFQSIVYEGKIHVLPKTFSPLDPGIRSDGTG
jgi:hypothetical protein